MIIYFLDLVVINLFVIVNQISWNSLVYHQHKVKNYFKFVGLMALSGLITFGLLKIIPIIETIPFLGALIVWLNKIISMFLNYLPKTFLLVWMVVPFILALVYFLIRSIVYFAIKKIEYQKWLKEKKQKEESEDQQLIGAATKEEESEIQLEEVEEQGIVEPENHFFELDLLDNPISEFSIGSPGEFKQTIKKAQKEKILINKSSDTYSMFVLNKGAYDELKKIALKNNLKNIPTKPSYIEVDREGIRTVTDLRELQERFKREVNNNE